MNTAGKWGALRQSLRSEWQHLAAFSPSERRWEMPIAAALAMGLPLVVGAYFERIDYGLVSCLGGLVFLYLPDTPMYHRMATFMGCAFAMAACYALGIMSHAIAAATIPLLVIISTLVTMAARYYDLAPPGSLFFIMVAAIGAYSPVPAMELPRMVGLMFMGSALAFVIAFLYSVYLLRRHGPKPVRPLPPASFDFVVLDSVVIGVFVGISLALAELLRLERPYWVPVSCLAVIGGASLRAVWNRQLQRVAGTAIGMLVAWALFLLPLNPWSIALAMMALAFIVESLVVRHYGIATIFITPLTILLAEAATLGMQSPTLVIRARFIDTVLGCAVGLLGGVCLHDTRFRRILRKPLRRMVPWRLVRRMADEG